MHIIHITNLGQKVNCTEEDNVEILTIVMKTSTNKLNTYSETKLVVKIVTLSL